MYKFLNFFSGSPKDGGKRCELPPPNDFVPEASFIWGVTTNHYIYRANAAASRRQRSTVELYDLYRDPFEINNLAESDQLISSKYSKIGQIIREIRAWAEAEIGRPPKAIVGQWNRAYEMMLKLAYKQQGYKQFIVDSRDWPVEKSTGEHLFRLFSYSEICMRKICV